MTAANGGGSNEEISRKRVLRFMKEADWPVTSKYVGDQLGTTQQTAYYYLQELSDEKKAERIKLTKNVVLWRPLSR